MIKNIVINNIALIDNLNINFNTGLSVLTGETGCGKSILLDCLGLALGYRSNPKLIKLGKDVASVTAIFDIQDNKFCKSILEENAIDFKDEMIIRRILKRDGASKVFVNDTPIGIRLLKKIGDELVELHGQHDQKGLLEVKIHGQILDEYGKFDEQILKVKKIFNELNLLKKNMQVLHDNQKATEDEKDYLQNIVNELDFLKVQKGEEEVLSEKRKSLMNKEKIIETLSSSINEIKICNAEKSLSKAQNILIKKQELFKGKMDQDIKNSIDCFDKTINFLEQAIDIVNEVMNSMLWEEDSDLEKIETRLFAIRNITRKLNINTDDLPDFLEEAKNKLISLENNQCKAEEIKKNIEKLTKEYLQESLKLREMRKFAAARLEESVHKQLKDLSMEKTVFKVAIEELDLDSMKENGIDKIAFLASINPGSPAENIINIASGGELSRFSLALKVAVASKKSLATMIFDEVDSGIGGATANAVGNKLKSLAADNRQVLSVTHHPQVASKSDHHFLIIKEQDINDTRIKISELNLEAKKNEIARMLSGEIITDEALLAASKLIYG